MNLSRSLAVLAIIFMLGTHSFAQSGANNAPLLGRFDVRDFGAKGDGTTLDTQAIEAAIQAANKAGGGTVVFLPGTYLTGTLWLLSNVTLDVETGAVILGSKNLADYPLKKDHGFGDVYGVNDSGEGRRIGVILAQNADNVAIVGHGVIDGNANSFFDFTKFHQKPDYDPQYTRQGQAYMDTIRNIGDGPIDFPAHDRPGSMIVFMHANNVLLRDVTLRNSPNWTLHLQTVQGGVIDGIHILNEPLIPNNDGIDCLACKNVHISNCEIRAGDDDFAIFDAEDITVTNCSMSSRSSAIRMEKTRNSVFSNLTMHANRGIGIYDQGEGGTDSVLFSNITIDTHLITGHWWGKAEPIYIAIGEAVSKHGNVNRIRFSNIVAEAENGIILYGDPSGYITNVSFDRVSLHLRIPRPEVNAAQGGNFDLRSSTDSMKTALFKHDIPAVYGRYVTGLDIHGLDIQWAGAMPSYYTSALDFEDMQDISIDQFSGRQATAGSDAPVIDLNRVKGISIRDSSATAGASTFLSTHDVTGERLFEGNDLTNATKSFDGKTSFTMYGNSLPEKKN